MNKVALFMLTALVSLSLIFSACSGSNDESKDNSDTAKPNKEGYTLPIVEDGSVTLTYAGIDNWYAPASYSQNLPVWQEIEERTGIKIKWEVMPASSYWNSINTRMASGMTLPDIIRVNEPDLFRHASEGLLIPLDTLIDQYAPNIKKLFADEPQIKNLLTQADGKIYSATQIMTAAIEMEPWVLGIRKDWLDMMDLQLPETLYDWYNALKSFKKLDYSIIPMTTGVTNPEQARSLYGLFGHAFGLNDMVFSEGWGVGADGKVSYTYIMPQYKDFLAYLNKLYEEGLIDHQLVQGDQFTSLIVNNRVGAVAGYTTAILRYDNLLKKSGVPDANYAFVLPPKGSNAEAVSVRRRSVSGAFSITKDCENQEAAIKWLDYIWASEEGRRLQAFGIEGMTYTMEDGKPKLTDFVTNNPDRLDPVSALRSVGAFTALPDYRAVDFWEQILDPVQIEFANEIKPNYVDKFPDLNPTPDEEEKLASLMTDINIYIDEMYVRFIIGNESLENFDNYIQTLKEMGIKKVIEIKQAQYDRYMSQNK